MYSIVFAVLVICYGHMDVRGKGSRKMGVCVGGIWVEWVTQSILASVWYKMFVHMYWSFQAFQFECKHTSHHLVQDHINKDVASCSAYSTTTMNHYWARTATETLVHLPNNDKQNGKMTNGSFDMISCTFR